MLCIFNNSNDAYFNMAVEEYVFTHFTDDIFMLWRNEPAIIVGLFQNSLAEINLDYVKEKNIKVVRRLTGGGAVFHDLQNLNFTFVESNSKGNFRTFTQPIIEVLNGLGVDARFEGRNDLMIDGRKFSGNAQCVSNGRMLHHGTLLFDTAMTDMSNALKVNPLKFEDKAVKSVRKRVTNISEHLKSPMTVLQFSDLIMKHIMDTKPNCRKYEFTDEDIAAITKLRDEKYSTWEWNFGHSPKYSYSKMIRTKGGNVELHLNIEKGIITAAKIYGDFFAKRDVSDFEKLLIGVRHEKDAVADLLTKVNPEDYFLGVTSEDVISLMF
ncbi:MAG: lipoate--protein ligase [Bacteroidales bacterium]|nr:lipoate--protein ligase [Bacteroidales bacterium]